MLNKIIKYSLYLLVFLTPLFFLPLTVYPVVLSKQFLVASLIFFALILWLIKIINSGEISIVWDKFTKLLLLLLAALLLSSFFSSAPVKSLWSEQPDSLFNFILYVLVFFLFANLLNSESSSQNINIAGRSVISLFLASSGVLALLFLVQAIFKIFPWDFARISGFNPIGSAQALSIYLGGAFVALTATIGETTGLFLKPGIRQRNIELAFAAILGVLLFVVIFLINFWVTWLGMAFGMGIIILGKLNKIDIKLLKENIIKNFGIPLIVFILALIFIFIRVPTANILDISPEVSPTYKLTFDIGTNTLKESTKTLILGTGPATFGSQYSLYRTANINSLSDLWQIRFSQGMAALPTFLTTFGILGTLLILLIIILFFWQGLKSVINGSAGQLIAFAGGFYFFFSWFFYSLNFSLAFASFLMLGLWVAQKEKTAIKEISFYETPKKAFFVMIGSILLIVGLVIGFYNISRKYFGAINYAQGLMLYKQELDIDGGIAKIQKALNSDRNDTYFRALSQLYLAKATQVLNNQDLSGKEKQNLLSQSVSNAKGAAQISCQIDEQESLNWLQLGNVYENTTLLGEKTGEAAIQNYNKAKELDPLNPQIPLNIGRVYTIEAQNIKQKLLAMEKAEEKDEEKIKQLKDLYNKDLNIAMDYFQKSIVLKENFSPAYFLTGQVYELQNKTDLALQNYQVALMFEPENKEIKAKIEALQKTLKEKTEESQKKE